MVCACTGRGQVKAGSLDTEISSSALRCCLLLPPALLPPVCPAGLSRPLSFLQPRPAGLSLGSHSVVFGFFFNLTSVLGGEKRGFLTACARVCVYEWCLCVPYLEGVAGVLLQEVRNVKLAGLGWEDLMPGGVVVTVETIPVSPAST